MLIYILTILSQGGLLDLDYNFGGNSKFLIGSMNQLLKCRDLWK